MISICFVYFFNEGICTTERQSSLIMHSNAMDELCFEFYQWIFVYFCFEVVYEYIFDARPNIVIDFLTFRTKASEFSKIILNNFKMVQLTMQLRGLIVSIPANTTIERLSITMKLTLETILISTEKGGFLIDI